MFKATTMVIGVIILLQGCSASSAKNQQADVMSNPAGATVFANGQELGVTPLHYKLYKAFPASWKDAMYQAHGVLMLKLDGCEDYTLQVNDYILSNPIYAELDCSDLIKAEESTSAVQEKQTPMVAPVAAPHSGIEERLQKLEALYNKGVITKEEYNATRERILNEL